MPHPRDWQGEQMARSSPGGGGGGWGCMGAAGIDWCISVVQILGIFKKKITEKRCSLKPFFTGNNSFNPKNEQSNSIEKKQVHFLQYIVHFVNPNMWMWINF